MTCTLNLCLELPNFHGTRGRSNSSTRILANSLKGDFGGQLMYLILFWTRTPLPYCFKIMLFSIFFICCIWACRISPRQKNKKTKKNEHILISFLRQPPFLTYVDRKWASNILLKINITIISVTLTQLDLPKPNLI